VLGPVALSPVALLSNNNKYGKIFFLRRHPSPLLCDRYFKRDTGKIQKRYSVAETIAVFREKRLLLNFDYFEFNKEKFFIGFYIDT